MFHLSLFSTSIPLQLLKSIWVPLTFTAPWTLMHNTLSGRESVCCVMYFHSLKSDLFFGNRQISLQIDRWTIKARNILHFTIRPHSITFYRYLFVYLSSFDEYLHRVNCGRFNTAWSITLFEVGTMSNLKCVGR